MKPGGSMPHSQGLSNNPHSNTATIKEKPTDRLHEKYKHWGGEVMIEYRYLWCLERHL